MDLGKWNYLNGFDGQFTSMIAVTIPRKIIPNSNMYEVGKLIVDEKTRSVYEKGHCEMIICDGIVLRNIIKENEETIFIFNVVTKDKTNLAKYGEVTTKTNSPFHHFLATSQGSGQNPYIQVKQNGNTVEHTLGDVKYAFTDDTSANSKSRQITIVINRSKVHCGELVCQINAERYPKDQAYRLAKSVILSAYYSILYLTEVSEQLVEEREKVS